MSPIIFMHYGDCDYLKYTFKLAIHNNPNARVILIGNESNKHYKKLGLEHYDFEKYLYGPLIESFEESYQLISGKEFLEINHNKGFDWIRFNFIKWFILHNFLRSNSIEQCWTFDSDNLILGNLASREDWFSDVDCTSRPNNSMILGKLNTIELLADYLETIIALFNDKSFLEKQKQDFLKEPKHAYTMMRAFMEFVRRSEFKYKIGEVEAEYNGVIFNTLIVNNKKNDFKVTKYGNGCRKRIFAKQDKIFVRRKHEILEIMVLDLSWVPVHFYSTIYNYLISNRRKTNSEHEISFRRTVSYFLRNKFYLLRKSLGLVKSFKI